MHSSIRDGNGRAENGGGEAIVKYGRAGQEDGLVTVLEWDNAEGVDVWLPDRDEALSLSWDDATALTAAMLLAELPRSRT